MRTLTVPVEGVVEELSLEMGGDPSRLDIYHLDLLCPLTSAVQQCNPEG